MEVPTSNARAVALAFDLDANHDPDNQLGAVAATLADQIGVTAPFDLSGVATARLANDVEWTLDVETCDDGSARLHGAAMPLSTLWDPLGSFADPGFVPATKHAIEITRDATGVWRGKVGMAFEQVALREAVIAPMARFLEAHRILMELFDTAPKDDHVSLEEMRASQLVQALLAPDLDGAISFGIGVTARE